MLSALSAILVLRSYSLSFLLLLFGVSAVVVTSQRSFNRLTPICVVGEGQGLVRNCPDFFLGFLVGDGALTQGSDELSQLQGTALQLLLAEGG